MPKGELLLLLGEAGGLAPPCWPVKRDSAWVTVWRASCFTEAGSGWGAEVGGREAEREAGAAGFRDRSGGGLGVALPG